MYCTICQLKVVHSQISKTRGTLSQYLQITMGYFKIYKFRGFILRFSKQSSQTWDLHIWRAFSEPQKFRVTCYFRQWKKEQKGTYIFLRTFRIVCSRFHSKHGKNNNLNWEQVTNYSLSSFQFHLNVLNMQGRSHVRVRGPFASFQSHLLEMEKPCAQFWQIHALLFFFLHFLHFLLHEFDFLPLGKFPNVVYLSRV